MEYKFTAKLWAWDSKTTWFFVSLPKHQSEEIKEITSTGLKRGFGSVRVEVTIGSSKWKTSIFPSKEEQAYVLPIKKSVRKAENLSPDSELSVYIVLVNYR